MLYAIVSHTPLWVWAMLAYLLYRGWIALHDREGALWKVVLIPLVLLGLSLHGLLDQFWGHALVLEAALLAALAAAVWAWTATPRNVTATPGSQMLFVRGSWRPMAMTLLIFALKYSVGVTRAIHPSLLAGAGISLVLGMLYGLFAGLSLGRVLYILHLSRRARLGLIQRAA